MIDFRRVALSDKAQYEANLFGEPSEQGCEYSFANLFMWGVQKIAFLHGCTAFFSHFSGKTLYPYPIGGGDKRAVIEEILQDAKERGIPCRIVSLTDADRAELESWFPGKFAFRSDRNSFDYVYTVEALADLRGKKLQKKRNHYNRFCLNHPDYRIEPLSPTRMPQAVKMVETWFEERRLSDPHGDYMLERRAISKAFHHYAPLDFKGIALLDGEELLALTMGTRLSPTTFDVHFEKAREDIDGAYTAINCEFARYLRLQCPDVQFLNREDDLGLEGLRQAKLSYHPDHLVEKFWAYSVEDMDNED